MPIIQSKVYIVRFVSFSSETRPWNAPFPINNPTIRAGPVSHIREHSVYPGTLQGFISIADVLGNWPHMTTSVFYTERRHPAPIRVVTTFCLGLSITHGFHSVFLTSVCHSSSNKTLSDGDRDIVVLNSSLFIKNRTVLTITNSNKMKMPKGPNVKAQKLWRLSGIRRITYQQLALESQVCPSTRIQVLDFPSTGQPHN